MICSHQECLSITEAFPQVEIKLAYLKGTLNMADSLTKFNSNPIKIINSDIYRRGPEIIRKKDFEDHIKIFLEVKGKDFQYTPVLNNEQKILSLQQELDMIFDNKLATKQINLAKSISTCKKIFSFPESKLKEY